MKDNVDPKEVASAKEVVDFQGEKDFVLKKDCVFKGRPLKKDDKVTLDMKRANRYKAKGFI